MEPGRRSSPFRRPAPILLMNADHDFQIGNDHTVCQDYALSASDGKTAYALICDGCSASPDVDFGARILARAARENLPKAIESKLDYNGFGTATIRRADCVYAMFPTLDPRFLDSTLLIAWVRDGRFSAFLYGDGVFFHRTKKNVRAVHVEFSVSIGGENRAAPAYLSYDLDKDRKDQYLALKGVKRVYDCTLDSSSEGGTEYQTTPFDPLVFTGPVEPGDVIGVCSDGINSFIEGGVRNVAWQEMLPQFSAFKSFAGVFVRRRVTAMLRECAKKQITHSDDISVAAIVV